MTIGFLINTCEPFYRGGYERRTWAFARELARQGHEVRIFTSCTHDQTIEGVRFVALAKPRAFFNRRGVRNGYADILFALGIFKMLSEVRAGELAVLDVCATPFIHLPVIRLVAWIKSIPLVLTCHEALLADLDAYVKERGHQRGALGHFLARLLALVYRFGMSLIPERMAVSSRTDTALAREGFPARAVVEFGLEEEAFGAASLPSPAGATRFISCGRLTPIKNVGGAIEAFLALRAEGISFRFDIIGDGGQRMYLEEKVRAAQAEDAIHFHGELSEKAKRDLFFASEVFVLSSPREGFSIATLEAMAQGCCAVVVRHPRRENGALDFVRDGAEGLCVAPGLEPMKAALRRLALDAELRWKLRRAARETAGQYEIGKQTQRLLEVYAEISGR